MPFFVYILYSSGCDKYYVGHTDSIDRRLIEHNTGKGGAFSTTCKPWKLVYKESCDDRSLAVKRERLIKAKKSRKYIEFLIQSQT